MNKYTHEQLVKWLLERGTIKGGASTVTYQYAGSSGYTSGTTVAPTTTQAAITGTITAQVQMGDTDTTATITHNWGFSTTQTAQFFPTVSDKLTAAPTTALPSTITFNTNSIVITKASGTGSGFTSAFTLQKPHSINL